MKCRGVLLVSVLCPAGWYRLDDELGTCVPCMESYYRTAEMDNCSWCGEGTGHDNWKTDMEGAWNRSQCKRKAQIAISQRV